MARSVLQSCVVRRREDEQVASPGISFKKMAGANGAFGIHDKVTNLPTCIAHFAGR